MSQILEKKLNDEYLYTLRDNNGQILSTAKTLGRSILETIRTIESKRSRGHGTKLLEHVEQKAKASGALTMKTSDIDPLCKPTVAFFKKNGYTLTEIANDQRRFLEGSKEL